MEFVGNGNPAPVRTRSVTLSIFEGKLAPDQAHYVFQVA